MARFPSVGEDFGSYRILRQLGRGGMGVVFAAEHRGLGRTIALKVLAPEMAEQPDYRERFTREATVLARLDSPHVVQVIDHGEHDGCLYIATQYVPGGDLADALRGHGPVPTTEAAQIAEQVAWALGDSHAAGVVHRDVKPSNVLLREVSTEVFVYLCDFGIAQDRAPGLTAPGSVAGTFAYLAPERLRGEPATASSDIYALGCVLFTSLIGTAPYGGSDVEIGMGHLNSPVPQLRDNSPVAAAVNEILQRSMAKDPTHRYPDAKAMRTDLRDLGRLAHGAVVPDLAPAVPLGTPPTQRVDTGGSRPSQPSGPRPTAPPVDPSPDHLADHTVQTPTPPSSAPPAPAAPATPPASDPWGRAPVPDTFAQARLPLPDAAAWAPSGPSAPSGPATPGGPRGRRTAAVVVAAAAAVLLVVGGVVVAVAASGDDDPDEARTSAPVSPTTGSTDPTDPTSSDATDPTEPVDPTTDEAPAPPPEPQPGLRPSYPDVPAATGVRIELGPASLRAPEGWDTIDPGRVDQGVGARDYNDLEGYYSSVFIRRNDPGFRLDTIPLLDIAADSLVTGLDDNDDTIELRNKERLKPAWLDGQRVARIRAEYYSTKDDLSFYEETWLAQRGKFLYRVTFQHSLVDTMAERRAQIDPMVVSFRWKR
ncbi:protein kinase [Nocardioides sp. C4-1]|uniref:serine/threonine-protein kinase n=1 Tax=Nocardioides sp. C4-1 TaxID=3151851 RepID=UPI0032650983